MPQRTQSEADPAASAPRELRAAGASNRRAAIVSALRRCMLEKGYAETSLTDLAKAANMSVSHLIYYYPSKEAALLDLSRQLNEQVLFDVGSHRDEPPQDQIRVLVDNVFVRGAISRDELVPFH
jgi:AcrR family transcriptional regulator